VAYMLATAYHECRFQAIKEIRAQPGTKIYDLQNRYWNTGFYGRGYIQLTWRKNYEKFSELLQQDFVGNPDLVLVPENAAKILVHGMVEG
ncbi:glycoside hydrolase family 19 protein, partial [Streptococcus pneumoniae]|uniref:glycoside hydrolase family 19 protein n=1 Tax=Streptococcus pneumoniae TaxID=1313 RepID=UPI00139BC88B